MNPKLAAQVNYLNFGVLVLTIFILPLLFLPLTSDYFEIPKLTFLTLAVCLMVFLRALTWVLEGRVLITKTPIDLPLLLIAGIGLVSAFFSQVQRLSFFGNLPRVHASALSWVVYVLFFFLAAQLIKNRSQVKIVLWTLIGSAVILGVLGILGFLGIYLPFNFAATQNFTPAESDFSIGALFAILIPVLVGAELRIKNRFLPQYAGIGIASFLGIVLALIGDLGTILASLIGIIGAVWAVGGIRKNMERVWLAGIPILAFGVVWLLTVMPLPSLAGVVHFKAQNFPRELQLPLLTSWKISASAFRDAPFIGTGPSTFAYDFTLYKPQEFNQTSTWNIRFDNAFNEFFQIFATLGLLGLIAFLALALIIVSFSIYCLRKQDGSDFLSPVLGVSGLVCVTLMLFHVTTIVSLVLSLVVIVLLIAENKSKSSKVEEISLGMKASRLSTAGFDAGSGDALPLLLFMPIVVLIVFVLWKGSSLVLADYHHRQGLNWASTNGINSYNELVKAEQLNPNTDLYRTDLAVTNFNIANAIAAQKGPSESSPAGSLTDQDKQTISTLLDQSIKEGQVAVAINPLSAQNWEVLASIYRQISGVAQNALQFSLDAYGHAIARDPLNPLLRVSVGGVYYSTKNYDLAVRFFTDSINLKPDYANGYYNLSVALRDQGRLQDAITSAEQVVKLLDPKSTDYKTAADYLADLKARAATESASQATTATNAAPPAASETGPLQQKELPKVLNLPQPGQIATPSAVKPNPSAKVTPTPSESPTESPSASSGGG